MNDLRYKGSTTTDLKRSMLTGPETCAHCGGSPIALYGDMIKVCPACLGGDDPVSAAARLAADNEDLRAANEELRWRLARCELDLATVRLVRGKSA